MIYEERVTDDRVIDRAVSPYVRPRWVQFQAHGLRAGVEIKLTFDGRQLPLSAAAGSLELVKDVDGVHVVEDISLFGNNFKSMALKTDAKGSVSGWFYIPPNVFAAGTKSVVVSDLDGTSSANATYTSRGTIVTRVQTITSIRSVERREALIPGSETSPTLNITNAPLSDSDTSEAPAEPILLTPPNDAPTSGPISYETNAQRAGDIRAPRWVDPVAQSFMVNTEGGCFVRSVNIWLATKPGDFESTDLVNDGTTLASQLQILYPNGGRDELPKTRPLTIYLVEMANGEPTANIVPFSTVNKLPSQLVSHPTMPNLAVNEIVFDNPVYLEAGTQYAIVLFSSSKEYNVWTAKFGTRDFFESGSLVAINGDRESTNLNAPVVSKVEDGTSLYLTRNSYRWDRETSAGLTHRVNICQFGPSAVAVMTDSKVLEDATYAGRRMKIWARGETYQKGDIISYVVPDSLYPTSSLGTEMRLFENKTGGLILPDVHPIDPVTYTENLDWTLISKNAYDPTRNVPNRYGFAVFPIMGELKVNGTEISYDHNFVTGPSDGSFAMPSDWFVAKNGSNNDVKHLDNGADLNGERLLNNPASGTKNNYALRAHLRSNNPNVSPVLDKLQMRATMLANIVRGVEKDLLWGGKSFSQVQTTFENSGYDAAYELGKLVKNQAYSKNHVVYLADDTETFFVYADTSPKTYDNGLTNDQLIAEFVDDVNSGIWIKNSSFRPPFIDGATGIGDCGTYISKPINLAQPAADLKVLLDVKTPGNSFVNVFYRFQKDAPQFVYTIPYDDGLGHPMSAFIGKKVKVKYRGSASDADALSSKNPVTGTLSNQLIINGIEEYIVTGEPLRYRLFVSSVGEENAFSEGVTFTDQEITGTQLFPAPFADVNTIFLIPDEITDLERVESTDPSPELLEWDYVEYAPGDLVLTMESAGAGLNNIKNSRLWRSNSYIAEEWDVGTAYSIGNVVLYRASSGNPFVAYRALTATTGDNPATATTDWMPLIQSNGSPWPAYGVGTAPSQLGSAWTYVPTLAIQSEVKEEELDTDWRPMSPSSEINTANLPDDKYYEWTFQPKVKPEVEFATYQIRIDMRNQGFDRVNVPSCRNLRTIAVL